MGTIESIPNEVQKGRSSVGLTSGVVGDAFGSIMRRRKNGPPERVSTRVGLKKQELP